MAARGVGEVDVATRGAGRRASGGVEAIGDERGMVGATREHYSKPCQVRFLHAIANPHQVRYKSVRADPGGNHLRFLSRGRIPMCILGLIW
jgi:hypothetical protein